MRWGFFDHWRNNDCLCRDFGRDSSQCPIHNRGIEIRNNQMQEAQKMAMKKKAVEQFETGATRDISKDKIDYEGFISPLATKAFGMFMHYNRELEDGSLRASDNWQLGIPLDNYIKSLVRHVEDLKLHHRGYSQDATQTLTWTLCAIIFNTQGYLHETLKKKPNQAFLDQMAEVKAREERRARAKRMAEL